MAQESIQTMKDVNNILKGMVGEALYQTGGASSFQEGLAKAQQIASGNTLQSGIKVNSPITPLSHNASNEANVDLRVRLAALHPADVYGLGGIMQILNETRGMLFPYTPQVQFSQSVNYMDLQLVHSDTDYPAYTRTPSVSLSVSGKFTVQNEREGQYAMACIHFLRTVSKSYFGEQDGAKAGLPPPVLLFSGYGPFMFNDLRVILKSHSWSFDDSVDMVTVPISGGVPNSGTSGTIKGVVKLPSLFTIQCELMVVQTPQRMRQQFSFEKFAKGELMQSQFPNDGWI